MLLLLAVCVCVSNKALKMVHLDNLILLRRRSLGTVALLHNTTHVLLDAHTHHHITVYQKQVPACDVD